MICRREDLWGISLSDHWFYSKLRNFKVLVGAISHKIIARDAAAAERSRKQIGSSIRSLAAFPKVARRDSNKGVTRT